MNTEEIICPHCKSNKVAKIVYGLPMFSEDLEKELTEGKVVLGGCVVPDNPRLYACKDCGKKFGKRFLSG